MRVPVRVCAVAAATAMAVVLVPAAAQAQVVKVQDPRHDARPDDGNGDISQVRIAYGQDRLAVTVRHGRQANPTNVYEVWVDTDAAEAGPEYLVTYVTELETQVSVHRVDDGAPAGPEVCAPRTGRLDTERRLVRFAVPTTCLGAPSRVRIWLHASDDYRGDDYSPGRRTFSRWVARG